MNAKTTNRGLFSFIKASPSPFHAARTIHTALDEAGFKCLDERSKWKITPGQPNYVIRDDGTVVAFNRGTHNGDQFRILGSHTDSPCLQLKPKADVFEKNYHKIGVEVYGGALLNPWFDRELSIAGRVTYRSGDNAIVKEYVDFAGPVAVLPSVAIHLDRKANSEKTINSQKDIVPLIGLKTSSETEFSNYLKKHLKKQTGIGSIDEILGFDLFFYDFHTPCYAGINSEFILSSRLDNLLSCFVITTAIAAADRKNSFMLICNNHEEVGSQTMGGAQGNIVQAVFERLYPESNRRHRILANSFFISVDNAHAVHPNHPEKHESGHETVLNGGPVIKVNANQRYTTNSQSNAVFKFLCGEVKVPYQEFVMRNDMACGSTIGPMTSAKLGLQAIDIGAPSLAMHSVRELTGNRDPFLMLKITNHFLNRESLPVVR